MAERNLDFDTVIDRYNTRSLKYDFAKRRGKPEGILPMWVADMDFATSSYVQDALNKQAEHGIFGYSEPQEAYFESVRGWMKRHYDWEVANDSVTLTPGIVYALAMCVRAFTKPGDKILIQQPVYYPFREVIKDNGRIIVSSNLHYGEDRRYHIDFEDFEKKIVENDIRLFFLCNPHNPGGRVWSREELLHIGTICQAHGVLVVSDEIHADFVFEGRHQVFENLKEEYGDFTITCTSPSKTFNLAGLQVSNIIIRNQKLRRAFRKEVAASGYSQLNVMGLVACEAAYRDGDEWYEALHRYIQDNISFTAHFMKKQIPKIKLADSEGTYLLWMDCRGLGLKDSELDQLMTDEAGLWLDSGTMFGESGSGFQRINVACPRTVLARALDRLKAAVDGLQS